MRLMTPFRGMNFERLSWEFNGGHRSRRDVLRPWRGAGQRRERQSGRIQFSIDGRWDDLSVSFSNPHEALIDLGRGPGSGSVDDVGSRQEHELFFWRLQAEFHIVRFTGAP